jgi:hypothetical protein
MIKKKGTRKRSKHVETNKIKNKEVLFSLLAIFLISVIALILVTDDNSQLTGNSVIQKISLLQAGSPYFLEVNTAGVKTVDINFIKTVKGETIQFDKVEEVNFNFEGKVYSMFKLSLDDVSAIGEVTYSLKLEKEGMKLLGLGEDEVKLYLDNKELLTTQVDKEDGFFHYTAVSNGIGTGNFLIGSRTEAPAEVQKPIPIIEEPISLEKDPTPMVPEEPAIIDEKPVKKGLFAWLNSLFS